MKIARLASLMLVAILAVGLAVASMASAAPEFKPTGAAVTGTGGTGTFTAGGETVVCAKDVTTATVTSVTLIGNIVIHLLECTAKTSTGTTCPLMSAGAPLENLILSKTLHAVLGLILPRPATGSDVALVLLPVSGSQFVTVLGSCVEESAVTGTIAGLVEPVGTSTTKGTLTFGVTSGVQNIKEVDLSTGGVVKPKFTAFGGTATAEATEAGTFSTATEVT
jgi:hypothetical protein